jgi:hypothetical protein
MRVRRSPTVAATTVLVLLAAAACGPTKPPAPLTPGGGGYAGDQNGPLGSCPVFPSTARPAYVGWNDDVAQLPVSTNSANYISNINANGTSHFVHPDFGGDGAYGIPYVAVPGTTRSVPINFTAYGDESDPGPYPIPLGAPVEGGPTSAGDRHVIAVDRDHCVLYELYRGFPQNGYWDADSGARFDLASNALRHATWTSADAAGLPVFPGLVRYDEVARGRIDHALRFTVDATQRGYILPALHWASTHTGRNYPPMGLRLRLDANYTLNCTCPQSQVVLATLKKYGMIVADNGSNWFITGAADSRWDDNDLENLKTVPGSAFEVVDTGAVCNNPASQSQSICGPP